MKDWEVVADNLSKAGWSWGCVSAIDSEGRTIWIVDAQRDDGRRFIVCAEEKLSAWRSGQNSFLKPGHAFAYSLGKTNLVLCPTRISDRSSHAW
jgi:hypothetical protein